MDQGIAEEAERLAGSGRLADAVRLLEVGARRGDADALFALAVWRLAGRHLPRDLVQSRTLFAHAAQGGRADALAIYLAFVANGTGAAADWAEAMRLLTGFARSDAAAREQLELIEAMGLAEDGAPGALPRAERLSDSPDVVLFRGFFTARECDYLAGLAEPMLEPAVVIDPRSGRYILDPVRKSDGAAFPLALENPAVRALNRRIAVASGTDVAQGEPLQIISYRPGQHYKPHLDAIAGSDNQRVLTMLVYLNEGYGGGETAFLDGGPVVRAAKGDAVLFRNVDAAGRPDPASRHAGREVTSGRKLIASRWIRERPIDLGDRPRPARTPQSR
jgi:prolyl 4-hydroxylase